MVDGASFFGDVKPALEQAIEEEKKVWAERAGADWEEKLRTRKEKMCVRRRLDEQRSDWTEADGSKQACLVCTSARRPCCFYNGKGIVVLPLPKAVRVDGAVAGELGFFVMGEGESVSKEDRKLWAKSK